MKKQFLLFITLFIFSASIGQNWRVHWQNNGFYDFDKLGNIVVGASTGDYFFVSTDSGKCFTPQEWPSYNIRFVQMISEDVIYVFTYYGTVYKTTDGGQNWAMAGSSIGSTFSRGMLFVDEQHGIASADQTVKITADGGSTWIIASGLAGFMSGFISTGNDKYVGIGYNASAMGLIRSYDITSPFVEQVLWTGVDNDELNCIVRIDGSTLYAFGRNKRLVSTDNGANWTEGTATIPGQSNGYMREVHFTSATSGVGIGVSNNGANNIYNTADGGVTWTLNTTLDQAGNSPEYRMHFDDALHGIAAYKGTLARTNDGGQTWHLQASDLFENINGVGFADEYTGAIVGKTGLVMVTHDGGNNFFSPGTITDREMNGVAWKDNMTGIVTGNQRTYRTTDGGMNWTQVNLSDFTVYYKAWYAGNNTFYMQGAANVTKKSTDSGQSWTTVDDVGGQLGVVSDQVLIYVSSTINRSTDGGDSWSEVETGFQTPCFEVCFVNANVGYALGPNVWKTTDGGANWTDLGTHDLPYNPSYLMFSHAWFVSENVGYINNKYDANIGTTTDGGQTWTPTPLDIQTTNDITFSTPDYGYLVASGGDLMVTDAICPLAEGGTVGIATVKAADETIYIYPNPFSGNITVEAGFAAGYWSVHDVSGKLMLAGNINADRFDLELGVLSNGLYILTLWNESEKVYQKLVKN